MISSRLGGQVLIQEKQRDTLDKLSAFSLFFCIYVNGFLEIDFLMSLRNLRQACDKSL